MKIDGVSDEIMEMAEDAMGYLSHNQYEYQKAVMACAVAMAKLRMKYSRTADNLAFVINHADMPRPWFDKFQRELQQDWHGDREGQW